MKFLNNITLAFVFVLASTACGNSGNQSEAEKPTMQLSKVHEVDFELDSRSVQDSEHFSVFEFEGKSYLAFFNKPDNSIKVYSMDTREKIQSIKLQTQGPNALIAIDSSPSNFYFKSLDSIYIYSSVQQKICLINSLANIIKCQKIISQRDDPNLPSYRINTLNPLRSLNENLYFIGDISWYEDGASPIHILSNNDVSIQVPEKLELYSDYNRLEIGTSEFFKASNAQFDQQTLLISYPMDHRIMRIRDGLINYESLQNKKLGELRPFGKEVNMEVGRSQEYFDFTISSGKYHAILTDQNKKLIYRVARLPTPMDKIRRIRESGESANWDFSILIYDYDFNLVGEHTFINEVDLEFNCMFIHNSDLYIRKTNDQEDTLTFAIYKTQTIIRQ